MVGSGLTTEFRWIAYDARSYRYYGKDGFVKSLADCLFFKDKMEAGLYAKAQGSDLPAFKQVQISVGFPEYMR